MARLASFLLLLLVSAYVATPAQAAPANPSTLHGVVRDPDGRPVSGASVIVSNGIATTASLTTDAGGEFRVDNLAAGEYDVRVTLEGFRADPMKVRLAAGEDRALIVPLHVSAVTESIVVTAAQVEVPLTRTSDSVTVITAADLKARQIDTFADALRDVPGLTLARNGSLGGVTSLFPRGGDSDFTLVLIDGVRANLFGGAFDFSQLPVADVERIEIVRGPDSALYGADAIGAVVQIVTRHGGPRRFEGALEAGSLGTSRLTASTAGSKGRWSWGAAAERLASDGFTGVAPASGERVTNDDYLSRHVSGSVAWRNDAGVQIRADGRLTSGARGFPGPFGSNPIGAFPGVDRVSRGVTDTSEASFKLIAPLKGPRGRLRERVQASYFDTTSDFRSTFGLSQSATRRATLRAQTDIALSSRAGASVGLEVNQERATSTFITGAGLPPLPITRRVIGYFGEVRGEAGSHLTVTGGLRVEQIRRDALEASHDPYAARPPLPTDSVVSVNPKVSAVYTLHAPVSARVHASAGTGIRPPDAIEIAFTDNPYLKPERSRSAEIGFDRTFAGETALVFATAFVNRYDDLIVAVGPAFHDASQYRTDNISNAASHGVELATGVRSSWGLDLRLTYTWLHTDILAVDSGHGQAPPPFTVGQPLVRRPTHQGSIDAVLTRGRLTAFAQLGARGRVLDVEPNYGAFGGLFYAPGYAVVGAGATVRITRSLEVFGRVQNLLDRRYEETLGFPAPARTVMVGVRVASRK